MNILITRPSPYGEELVNKLISIGKLAYHFPLIYFSSGKTLSSIQKKLSFLSKGDFLLIVSQHAATYAHYKLLSLGIQWPTTIKYYTIGRNTSLKMYMLSGILAKFPLYQETSETLLQLPELIHNVSGRNILILKGNNGGRDILKNTLKKRGALVLNCNCYTRQQFQYNGLDQYNRFLSLNIKTIVVTTEEMLKQLFFLIPLNYRNTWLLQCRLIVVSTRLSILAYQLGWTNIIITKTANNTSIFITLTKYT